MFLRGLKEHGFLVDHHIEIINLVGQNIKLIKQRGPITLQQGL